MCSICGIAFQKDSTIIDPAITHKILQNLLINCQARGRSATGIAVADDKRIMVVKNNLVAEKFVETAEFKEVLKQYVCFNPIQIIGHCRMPTKGTPLNNKNNHPIVTKSFVGVHNGIIHNDDILFNKHKNDFERDGEVDSEIIFKLIEKYYISCKDMPKAIRLANSKLFGGMAYAFITTKNPYLLWLFRYSNPISILHYRQVGMVIFASSEEYITNAVKEVSIGVPCRISMELHEGIEIDLFNNTMHHFKMPESSNTRIPVGFT